MSLLSCVRSRNWERNRHNQGNSGTTFRVKGVNRADNSSGLARVPGPQASGWRIYGLNLGVKATGIV